MLPETAGSGLGFLPVRPDADVDGQGDVEWKRLFHRLTDQFSHGAGLALGGLEEQFVVDGEDHPGPIRPPGALPRKRL